VKVARRPLRCHIHLVRLSVPVADLGGESEGGGVLGTCLAQLSGGMVGLAETVEGEGFTGSVAQLARQGQ